MLETNFFACFYFPSLSILHFCTALLHFDLWHFRWIIQIPGCARHVPGACPIAAASESLEQRPSHAPEPYLCTSDSWPCCALPTNKQRGKSFYSIFGAKVTWKSFPFGTPLLLGGLDRSGASPTLTQAGLECKGFYMKMASRTSWQDLLSTTLPSPVTSSISYFDKNRPSFCILQFYSVTSWILAHCYNTPHLGSELTCRTPSSYLRCFHCHS